jgi:hypothetical protein
MMTASGHAGSEYQCRTSLLAATAAKGSKEIFLLRPRALDRKISFEQTLAVAIGGFL